MPNMTESPLRDLLIDKAKESKNLAHSLHWHLELERSNPDNKPNTKQFFSDIWNELMTELERESPELW